MKRLFRLVLCAGVFCLATMLAPATAQAYTVGIPIFNTPSGTLTQQRVIVDRLIRATNAARRGTEIRILNYSFQDAALATALIKADKRHVNVRLITNHHLLTPSYMRLAKRLGTNVNKRSWVKRCVGSCRGPAGGGTQHAKFYLFSGQNLVMIGSSNVTPNAIYNQWNDIFVMRNAWLHSELVKIFTQMKYDRPATSPVVFANGPLAVYLYPRPESQQNDTIAHALDTIGCKAGTGYGYHGHTVVSIDLHGWTDARGVMLAHKVHQLWKDHCKVQMIWGDSVGARIKTILKNVPHVAWRTGRPYTHLKVMMVSGQYGHDKTSELVWTGSANWSGGYNRRDEIVLRINDRATYQEYRSRFIWMWHNY